MYKNKVIECEKCKKSFILSAGEQSAVELFGELKEGNCEPTTCRICRGFKKELLDEITIECKKCKKSVKVMFSPDEEREIYCFKCAKSI